MHQLASAVKAISIVTAAEMRYGALKAGWGPRKQADLEAHLRTYLRLPIDDRTAAAWAHLKEACVRLGRTKRDNDLWIAASSIQHRIAVASLDGDFDDMPGVTMIRPDGSEGTTP